MTLILGGARSGKSRHATDLASRSGGEVVFLATGAPVDPEMADRIARHRRDRPPSWRTIEQSRDLATVLQALPLGTTVLIDGLGDVATEYLLAEASPDGHLDPAALAQIEARLDAEVDGLVAAQRAAGIRLIVVSNEVGSGLVPPYPLGRYYRDILGRANQRLAAQADRVLLMVAGLPLTLKPPADAGSFPSPAGAGEGQGE
ncbi:MAG TPA: bifunctional adenosylcobinamide kinase/adenosylcobinamide-phosphate guanylyltransferase [Dehalococcoidia bacterium]|nr:bifunctional adenosylcobinamide kinase/adenosylcobinamide-phosphate guanylyltransferase [Dehalococcoidia bacterium]